MAKPLRAEIVGSLLRPAFLVEARTRHAAHRIGTTEFKLIEDRAVDQAIALQAAVGLDVVNDGELRRGIFTGPLTESVEGLEYVPGVTRTWYTDDGPVEEELPLVVTGRLRARPSTLAEELTYLRARADRPIKVTVPSPLMMFLRWSPQHSAQAYADPFEMAAHAADIVRDQIRELAGLGCTYVQIDAPELATLVQQDTREWFARQGVAPEAILREGIDLLDSVTDVAGVEFGIHLCRGNRNGRWMASGGYDYLSDAIFRRAKGFRRYLLEYDDHRSGGFEPLDALPNDAVAVLGLVSTKNAIVEDTGVVLRRLHDAAEFVSLDQLAVSTQCGFASMVEAHPDLTQEIQEAKLRIVAEAAAEL